MKPVELSLLRPDGQSVAGRVIELKSPAAGKAVDVLGQFHVGSENFLANLFQLFVVQDRPVFARINLLTQKKSAIDSSVGERHVRFAVINKLPTEKVAVKFFGGSQVVRLKFDIVDQDRIGHEYLSKVKPE